MTILFWTLWIAEFVLNVWWLFNEMKLTYLKTNPYVYISLLYLLAALAVRFGAGFSKTSLAMVAVPAIPLAGMLLIVIISVLTGARWN